MQTRIIEVSQDAEAGFNWGKFCVARFDTEWDRRSRVDQDSPRPLLSQCGWDPCCLWVLDLQTGEGAFFAPGGSARADLQRHRIWVCVLFEPFLTWLYQQQDLDDLSTLPDLVELPDAPAGLYSHRRPGPATVHVS